MQLQIVKKQVHGPRGIESAYDIELDGKFVSRHERRSEARRELATMQRLITGYGGALCVPQ